MANIKFIKKITDYIERDRNIIGNFVYYNLANGNKAKLWCEEHGVIAEIINKTEGKVDRVTFPFSNYFEPVCCSPGAPAWTQTIKNDKWYFEDTYKHVLPKEYDYLNLAEAISTYIEMYE